MKKYKQELLKRLLETPDETRSIEQKLELIIAFEEAGLFDDQYEESYDEHGNGD